MVWTLVNVALLGLLPLLFAECISFVARRPYLGLLGFAFPPVIAGLTPGQDSILILFFISAAYLLGRQKAGVRGRLGVGFGHCQISNCVDPRAAPPSLSKIPSYRRVLCGLWVSGACVCSGYGRLRHHRVFQIRAAVRSSQRLGQGQPGFNDELTWCFGWNRVGGSFTALFHNWLGHTHRLGHRRFAMGSRHKKPGARFFVIPCDCLSCFPL